MPHKHQKEKALIPRDLRRNVKLTLEQREEIRENAEGLSLRGLATKYGVSRTTIAYILDPKKHAASLEARQKKGGWKQYYNKEKHRQAMREYLQHKTKLDKQGVLYYPTQTEKDETECK